MNWIWRMLFVVGAVLSVVTSCLALMLAVQTREALVNLEHLQEYDGLEMRVARGIYEFFSTARHRRVIMGEVCGREFDPASQLKHSS